MSLYKGWIKLYRSIEDHWIWKSEEPFDRRSAWIDLLLMVNHEENKIFVNGQLIKIDRGQTLTSIKKLSERWKWSRWKVKKFLQVLQDDYIITFEIPTGQFTLVTVENYGKYQDKKEPTDNETTSNRQSTDNRPTIDRHPTDTNKNDKEYIKNDKNDKEEYARAREVTEFFNSTAGKNYSVNDCKPYVEKLISQGYKVEDIKHVIQVKSEQWKGDQKMDQYLRPMTLFGEKFSSYLQEQSTRMKGVLYL